MAGFGLALSGGGLLGAAHLGVLEALAEARLQAEAVAGTSAGGLVASLYALGTPPALMVEAGRQVARQPWRYFDVQALAWARRLWDKRAIPPTGLLDPRRFIAHLLALAPGARTTAAWRLPCALTAVDVVALEAVAFTAGPVTPPRPGRWRVEEDAPLALAMQATMAMPGLFAAPRTGGAVLVDGGVADTLPVDWAHALAPLPVLAVNVAQPGPAVGARMGLEGVLARSEVYLTETMARLRAPAVPAFPLNPDTQGTPFFGFSDYDRLVEIGYRAMRAALPAFLTFLERHDAGG
jgi:NTE family protein